MRPRVGLLMTDCSSVDPNALYGKVLASNLPRFGDGLDVVDLDYHALMSAFEKKHPEAYQHLSGVSQEKKANIDLASDPGRQLRRFVANHIEGLSLHGVVGGGDYYNVVPPNLSPSPNRILVEKAVYSVAKDKGMPIYGVCGTMQHIAYLAGAEITSSVEKVTGHNHAVKDGSGNAALNCLAHQIFIKPHSLLAGALESPRRGQDGLIAAWVNSYHKQGVLAGSVSRRALEDNNIEIVALDNTAKIVEAMEQAHGAPSFLMQSHPEYELNRFQKNISSSFARSALAYAQKSKVVTEVKCHGFVRNLPLSNLGSGKSASRR